MTKEQKKLEELILKHIENQVEGKGGHFDGDTIATNAIVLIELWKMENPAQLKLVTDTQKLVDLCSKQLRTLSFKAVTKSEPEAK